MNPVPEGGGGVFWDYSGIRPWNKEFSGIRLYAVFFYWFSQNLKKIGGPKNFRCDLVKNNCFLSILLIGPPQAEIF